MMVLDPYFQEIVETKVEEIIVNSHACEYFATPLKSEAMLKKTYHEELINLFKLSDARATLEAAEKIILVEMPNFTSPEKFEKIKQEIVRSGEHFVQFVNTLSNEKVKNSENPILLQQVFGLSNESLLQIYNFAANLVKKERFDEAACIFALLSTLAPHVSSYWIGQGACLQALGKHDVALVAFEVAKCIKADNPSTLVYTIESYLALKDKEKAASEMKLLKKIVCTFESDEKNYWMKRINEFQLN